MDEQGTAVALAPAAQTLEALQAEVATKERDKEAFTEALGAMWQQRQHGTLPLERYPEYLYTEDQLRVTLQDLERLQPRLLFAEKQEAIGTATAQYDRYCEPVEQAGMQVCYAWQTFLEKCAAFVALVDEQERPLMRLTRADGQPAFEFDGGAMTLQRMLTVFPGQPAQLVASVIPFLQDLMTVGQSQVILEHVKGKVPFADAQVHRFLADYAIKEPAPAGSMEDPVWQP